MVARTDDCNPQVHMSPTICITENSEQLQRVLSVLRAGSYLLKVRSKRNKHLRLFKLDDMGVSLRYEGSKKLQVNFNCCLHSTKTITDNLDKVIFISQIREVREGTCSDVFIKAFHNKKRLDPARCFTIDLIDQKHTTLDLIASHVDDRDAWVYGIRSLIKTHAGADLATKQNLWLREVFCQADKNGDKTLNFNEIVEMLKQLNLSIDVNHAKQVFRSANSDATMNSSGEDCLNVDEFMRFYEIITKRREIEDIFHEYDRWTGYIHSEDLIQFFQDKQHLNMTSAECCKVIKESEACPEVSQLDMLSISGFYGLLGSPIMDIMNPRFRKVYENMDQPLSHYFIDSSHNTYLCHDQLLGASKVESYLRALLLGCRCVELDVWDGDNGDPVIYHGYTLTSKILFKDVIEAINENAFKASQYPVILSIENHCSIEQQKQMAGYMRRIFGSKLLTESLPDGTSQLPSPTQLKRRIIVKGKKLISNEESSYVSDEDEAAEIEDDRVKEGIKKKKKGSKQKLAIELSDCVVICQSSSFKSFQDSKQSKTFKEISSFSESKAAELGQSHGVEFVQHNTCQLSRVYPAGSRTDSSNYDPVPMWVCGCHIVALNYQTSDEAMFVNKGMFEDNGGCGYILKPEFMRTQSRSAYNPEGPFPGKWKRKLELTVISGNQLPKKKGDKASSILDPYVRVDILGVKSDQQFTQTTVINNNGFNPVWNKKMEFEMQCPDLALVLVRVIDHESRKHDVVVAQYCLPFRCMQTGYRTVHLKSVSGEQLWSASLLVHVVVSE